MSCRSSAKLSASASYAEAVIGIWLPVAIVVLAVLIRRHPQRMAGTARVHLEDDPADDPVFDPAQSGGTAAMSDPRIPTVRPQPDDHASTFGGAEPVARIDPGTVLDVFAEDCFAGHVRSEKDDVHQFVCQAVESPLAHVRDTHHTCVAELRKEWLPGGQTHRGLHTRPRRTAAALSP